MIHKQQVFIEENDIGMSPSSRGASKYTNFLRYVLDIEMFLGENNDLEAEYEDMEENNNLDEPEDYDNN